MTKKMYLFKHDVVAEFLGQIVRIAPMQNELPNLNAIAKDIHTWLDDNIVSDLPRDMFEMLQVDVRKMCDRITTELPSVEDLNLSKVERERGVAVHDPRRPSFVGSSAHDRVRSEHDFIDLGALAMNVDRALCREYYANAPENTLNRNS